MNDGRPADPVRGEPVPADGGCGEAATPLRWNVDPQADGRQHGHVALADRSNALDRPRLPLTVLRRGDGPRIVLAAGSDGERSGSLALRRLARELDPAAISGTVVILPDVPRTAFVTLVNGLVGEPDTLLELVGAPPGFGFSPHCALSTLGPSDVRARAEAAMVAFGAHESVRFGPGLAPGAVGDALAERLPHVRATLGGGVAAAEAQDIALVGCRNVLVASGVLDGPFALRATRTLAVDDAGTYVHAPTEGLLELRARPGQTVYRGDPLAFLVDASRPGVEPLAVRVPRDGVVLGARTDARVRAGDCIAVVADERPR